MEIAIFTAQMVDLIFRESHECGANQIAVFRDSGLLTNVFDTKGAYERSLTNAALNLLLHTQGLSISHEESGAPVVRELGEFKLSISHSNQLFALQLSRNLHPGIDVQQVKKRLAEGTSYFMNTRELRDFPNDERTLYSIWSAKEAAYKVKKGQVQSYKEDLWVTKMDVNTIHVDVLGELLTFRQHFLDDFLVVYAI